MDSTDKLFAGAIPDLYDRLMVPMLFDVYAADLAERVAAGRPRDVLEIAAGTGALTRAMASRLDADAQIIATDLNQPMLDRAKARLAGDARIAWQQADAQALPFKAGSFDIVACQFGVMFFPDKREAYGEALRVLKVGGHYLFNAWDRIAENDFPDVVTAALVTLFPDDPPRFMERVPHGYHDPDLIRGDLEQAGFGDITIETLVQTSVASSAQEAARAYCQGTPLRAEIEARAPGGLEAATQSVADAMSAWFGGGAIRGKISALVVSAVRP